MKRSAMILAGGEAKRVDGRAKYFFSYQGCSFIARLVNIFSGIVDEVVIVARNKTQTEHFIGLPEFVRCTWDKEPGLGPIGGITSGITEIKGDSVFIAACDMPTISKAVVTYLFDNLEDYDAIVPQWENAYMEPLHAVYRTDAVKNYLNAGKDVSLRQMLHSLHTRKIKPEDLRRFDADLETFRNVNTLADLLAMGPEASYQEKHTQI